VTGSSLATCPTRVFLDICSAVGLTTTGCRNESEGVSVIRLRRIRVVRRSVDVFVAGKVEWTGVTIGEVAIGLKDAARALAANPGRTGAFAVLH
jgi:hypothetical protein